MVEKEYFRQGAQSGHGNDNSYQESESYPLLGVPAITGVPLVVCQVIFLGAESPEPHTSGLLAVQKPLNHLYQSDIKKLSNEDALTKENDTPPSFFNNIIKGGVAATLAVYSFGLKLVYSPAGNHEPAINLWFPISNLFVCAAVRGVRSMPPNRRFVPLDLAEADESDEAPLFAAIFRQSRARHKSECFCFECNSKQSAMELVIGCTNAFEAFVKGQTIQPIFLSTIPSCNSDDENPANNSTSGVHNQQANQCNEDRPIIDSSNNEADDNDWQPILMRRVWLPTTAAQTPLYPTTDNVSSSLSRKASKKMYFPSQTAFSLPPFFDSKYPMSSLPDASLLLASPTPLAVTPQSTSPQIQPYRHQEKEQKLFAKSKFIGKNYKKDAWKGPLPSSHNLNDSHRKWLSQPSLGNQVPHLAHASSASCLSEQDKQFSPFPKANSHKNKTHKKQQRRGFVSRIRNFIFPPKNRLSHSEIRKQNTRIPSRTGFSTNNTGGGCSTANCQSKKRSEHHQNGGNIDYATVASDEADLLAVQADCYGSSASGNTIAKHPLPNEKAFMISIRNQQQRNATVTCRADFASTNKNNNATNRYRISKFIGESINEDVASSSNNNNCNNNNNNSYRNNNDNNLYYQERPIMSLIGEAIQTPLSVQGDIFHRKQHDMLDNDGENKSYTKNYDNLQYQSMMTSAQMTAFIDQPLSPAFYCNDSVRKYNPTLKVASRQSDEAPNSKWLNANITNYTRLDSTVLPCHRQQQVHNNMQRSGPAAVLSRHQ